MTDHSQSTNPSWVVGIGASAGGLDPLQSFIAALPQEFDFAMVFIQHLSAKHKSLLSELLSAKNPSLAIEEISDGLRALPGKLYLCPPGQEARISKGVFHLTQHPKGLIHLPIDEFFASLAKDAADHGVAVIFSGAGTDGARGSMAIRDAGGTVFVQEPATAEFSSMPLAAIAAGHADAVLPPQEIAREIQKVVTRGAVTAKEPTITSKEYDALFRMLLEKTGSRFTHYKKSVLSRRIKRRMFLHGVSTVQDYLDLATTRDAEAVALTSDLLIGVTSFFRDRVAWKALNNQVVRKLVGEDTGRPVRVWTPATATGEEAFSITMMLAHELSQAERKREIMVFATDVNNAALEKAREGRYPASISVDVPEEYLQKYFSPTEDGQALIVNKEIRERVVFARHDLLTDPPFSRLDLIICRNFMIYLEPDAQEKCITLFHYALKDGGYLFLGNAETVGKKTKLFKSIGHKQCRVYRKIETNPASRLPLPVPYAAERTAGPPAPTAPCPERQPFIGPVQEFLLEEFAPAAIAIDQNYDVLYHNGPTNRYLRQPRGVPTLNLLALLPEALRKRVRSALFRVGQEGKPVAIRASLPGGDDHKKTVTIRLSKLQENLFVIIFREKGGAATQEEGVPLEDDRIEETAIRQLESELSATRQDLQSHIEQLKGLNEELQSSNEELQAANEELETSREELQSLNEELITVNNQFQAKIEEQEETNNDLNNFLASTNIPTMFLDRQFKVRRFTPAMLKLIKLLPSDVGRPIM
ncbi:MAG: CheR family methyltransferase, partial [Deltaproteobacteria bacterium]